MKDHTKKRLKRRELRLFGAPSPMEWSEGDTRQFAHLVEKIRRDDRARHLFSVRAGVTRQEVLARRMKR